MNYIIRTERQVNLIKWTTPMIMTKPTPDMTEASIAVNVWSTTQRYSVMQKRDTNSSQIYHYRQTQRSVLSDIKYAVILCMFVSMCSVIDISAEVPPIGVKFARR